MFRHLPVSTAWPAACRRQLSRVLPKGIADQVRVIAPGDGLPLVATRSDMGEAAVLRRVRHALRVRLLRVVEEVADRHRRDLEQRLDEMAGRHRRELEDTVRREVDRVISLVRDVEFRDRRDLAAAAERDAVTASARFARNLMPTVPTFRDPIDTLEHALKIAPADGMALEFGVCTGGTLKLIAQRRDGREVYGFDSFQGLPEDWRTSIPAGAFAVDELPEVDGAELVVGWFADTLPGFLATHPGPVAFVHLDADLYSSTKTVLDHLGPRLRSGTVIVFDEYFNYPGWEQHEHRAWEEFVARSEITFRYEGYTADNEQVVVRVTDLRAASG